MKTCLRDPSGRTAVRGESGAKSSGSLGFSETVGRAGKTWRPGKSRRVDKTARNPQLIQRTGQRMRPATVTTDAQVVLVAGGQPAHARRGDTRLAPPIDKVRELSAPGRMGERIVMPGFRFTQPRGRRRDFPPHAASLVFQNEDTARGIEGKPRDNVIFAARSGADLEYNALPCPGPRPEPELHRPIEVAEIEIGAGGAGKADFLADLFFAAGHERAELGVVPAQRLHRPSGRHRESMQRGRVLAFRRNHHRGKRLGGQRPAEPAFDHGTAEAEHERSVDPGRRLERCARIEARWFIEEPERDCFGARGREGAESGDQSGRRKRPRRKRVGLRVAMKGGRRISLNASHFAMRAIFTL